MWLPGRLMGGFLATFLVAFPVSFLALSGCANAQRLPTIVIPEHYDLAFDVDLTGARFSGVEAITARLAAPTRRVVLHALDLRFQEVAIVAAGAAQPATFSFDAATETATLTTPKQLPAGAAEIRIRYTGILNDKLRGFYLSRANGRSYAITQFESTDARRAFPSFDEPALKATFSLAVTIDRDDTAISNGRLLSDTPGPGANRHTLTFAETPKMSSYLVAMAIGDFECLEGRSTSVPIRICATPDKKELGHIALEAATKILTFYNSYYSIRYPFDKLDAVAVPDFAAGAMENTAAIFFREVDLLDDARTASVGSVKRIWAVLAHEMAHQWFGDLVTMRWWDDLWLNEGFATWMEKHPLGALHPEWKTELDEVSDTHSAMNLDALASTRPIHSAVETPAEIEGSFDAIAYEKGASVMRMIEGLVGPDVFRQGVNSYLEKHAYGNATSADFWTEMTARSGQPIDRILPTFVNQPGVPVVNVIPTCTGNQQHVALQSHRFFTDPTRAKAAPMAAIVWQIPLCIKTRDANAQCQILNGPTADVTLNSPTCEPWAFVNAGAHGYFRTAYPPMMLRALAPDVATRLTEAERLSLLGDEWALVRAGQHTVADYLMLASGFGRERTNGVLEEVTRRLAFIHDGLVTTESGPLFERFVQRLLRPLFDELDVRATPGEDDDRRALRGTVIAALGGAGNDDAVATKSREAIDAALSGGLPLDPTAAGAILAVAARHGDAALWDRLLAAAKNSSSQAERYRYLYSLAAFEDPALIDRGLNFALSSDLRAQDTPIYLARYLGNPAARVRTWTFVKQHWTELAPKFTISLGDVRVVEALGGFCDAGARDDISAFLATHRLPATSRSLTQAIERINTCIAIKTTQERSLGEWLQTR